MATAADIVGAVSAALGNGRRFAAPAPQQVLGEGGADRERAAAPVPVGEDPTLANLLPLYLASSAAVARVGATAMHAGFGARDAQAQATAWAAR